MVRRAAVGVLVAMHRSQGPFANEAIDAACSEQRLPKRDRRFLTELVYGVERHRIALDAILSAYSRMAVDELAPAVREALRLGVYQLLYLDGVPAFAAVHETVAAVSGPPKLRSFVNGVLRAIDRQVRRVPPERDRGGASPRKRLPIGERKVCFFSRSVFTDPAEDEAAYLSQRYSHGSPLVRRWLAQHGREKTEAMLERNNRPPLLFARANCLRVRREELLQHLREEGMRCAEGSFEGSVRVEAPPTELVRTKAFRRGECSIQDETAMQVAPRLGVRPQHKILDLCAAPGGKTYHLAELTGDQATIFAVDRDASRLARLEEGCERLGLQSVAVLTLDLLEVGETPHALPAPFPRILLDAPCSNSGVLGRRPEARYRWDAKRLQSLTALQHGLLDRCASLLAYEGQLIYSTCSIEPEENGEQIRAFLTRHNTWTLLEQWLTLPADGAGDGGYCALLKKQTKS